MRRFMGLSVVFHAEVFAEFFLADCADYADFFKSAKSAKSARDYIRDEARDFIIRSLF